METMETRLYRERTKAIEQLAESVNAIAGAIVKVACAQERAKRSPVIINFSADMSDNKMRQMLQAAREEWEQ